MKNRLFDIKYTGSPERQEGSSSAVWIYDYRAEIIAAHPVFKGHFPDSPVVPGVCSMDMIKECAAHALSRPVRFGFIKECKFLCAIVPDEHKELDVRIEIAEGSACELTIAAEIAAAGTKMMKLKATLVR